MADHPENWLMCAVLAGSDLARDFWMHYVGCVGRGDEPVEWRRVSCDVA